MPVDQYNIVMFAYNEEATIENSIRSVYDNTDSRLGTFHLLANGCKDSTVSIARDLKASMNFEKLSISDIKLGDKCNAWNLYVHDIADNAATHFFVDADVSFSENSFPKLHDKLTQSPNETEAIAGMPLSGRNFEFYRSLVIERSCFFGNCYGVKHSFIDRCQLSEFCLPIGLNWIDSFLTKAVNTELTFDKHNRENKVTYEEGIGYHFESLSPFSYHDMKLYINRIARYELGKLQEQYLDALSVADWPEAMNGINDNIEQNFANLTQNSSFIKKMLIKYRLNKVLKTRVKNH